MEDLLKIISDIPDEVASSPQGFGRFAVALLEKYEGAAANQKVLLYELSLLPPRQKKKIVKMERELIEYAERLLAKAVPHLKLSNPELRARVMLFFGMLNWSHSWFDPKGPINRDRLAEMAANNAIKGI